MRQLAEELLRELPHLLEVFLVQFKAVLAELPQHFVVHDLLGCRCSAVSFSRLLQLGESQIGT